MQKYMKSIRMRIHSEMKKRGIPVYYVSRSIDRGIPYMSFTFDSQKSISAHLGGNVHIGIHRIPFPEIPNSSEVVKKMCDALTELYKKENNPDV